MFKLKKEFTVALEITDSHVRVFQAKSTRTGAVLTHVQYRPIELHTDDELAKLITQIFAGKAMRTREVIVAIPRRLMILRQMILPSQDTDEIRKMVDLQIINKVPYSKDDIIYDYSIISREATGYTKVLAAIVHKDVVQQYLRICTKAKIFPQKVTLSSIGLLSWYGQQQKKASRAAVMPVSLLNIESADSEIVFMHDGRLLFSRGIPMGVKDINEANVGKFLEQIDLTLKSYQKDNMGPAVERFILVSSFPGAQLLKERLSLEYQKAVDVLSPLDHLSCSKDLKTSVLVEGAVSPAVGLGLAAASEEDMLNFTPSEIKNIKISSVKRDRWMKSAFLTGATLLLAALAFNAEVYRDAHQLNRLRSKMEAIKPQVTQAKKTMAVVDFVREHIYNRVLVADLITELYRLTPADIAFRSLQMDENGGITLLGFSQSGSSVNTFQGQLVGSGILTDVNLQYASKVRSFNQELTEFKMTCHLKLKKRQGK